MPCRFFIYKIVFGFIPIDFACSLTESSIMQMLTTTINKKLYILHMLEPSTGRDPTLFIGCSYASRLPLQFSLFLPSTQCQGNDDSSSKNIPK